MRIISSSNLWTPFNMFKRGVPSSQKAVSLSRATTWASRPLMNNYCTPTMSLFYSGNSFCTTSASSKGAVILSSAPSKVRILSGITKINSLPYGSILTTLNSSSSCTTTNYNIMGGQQILNKRFMTSTSTGKMVVTLEEARQMPLTYSEMENGDLIRFAGPNGPWQANEERVIRNIMAVDGVSWEEAQPRIDEMRDFLEGQMSFIWDVPYYVGLFGAVGWACGTIPLIFSARLVKWFNEKYVTMEVPPPSELDTVLEVGSWSWSWMEPVIGEASFLLLCAQFARSQMQNLAIKPYTEWLRGRRARKLQTAFPQYNMFLLKDYAKSFGN